jgi:hypothetical protein
MAEDSNKLYEEIARLKETCEAYAKSQRRIGEIQSNLKSLLAECEASILGERDGHRTALTLQKVREALK